jgi:hypothetical protein
MPVNTGMTQASETLTQHDTKASIHMAATRITPQTTWQRCCLMNRWQFPLSPSNEKRNRPSPHQQDSGVHSSNPPSKHASSFEAVWWKPKPAVSTPIHHRPARLPFLLLPNFPNQESPTFYRLHYVLFFGLAALHQGLMRACLAGLNELTTIYHHHHYHHLPLLHPSRQAINPHREFPSIIHALAPMTRHSLATPVNAAPSTDHYYSSLQSFSRLPSHPATASAWADRGVGKYSEQNKIDFLSMPKKAHPISNVLESSRVHLIYFHEHVVFAAQYDTTLPKKKKSEIDAILPSKLFPSKPRAQHPRSPDLRRPLITTVRPYLTYAQQEHYPEKSSHEPVSLGLGALGFRYCIHRTARSSKDLRSSRRISARLCLQGKVGPWGPCICTHLSVRP